MDQVDLYQQMLWDARKMEDVRLAKMIQERLGRLGAVSGRNGGNLVQFPGNLALDMGTEQIIFWKDNDFWKSLIQFFILMTIVGGWFFMPFIKIIISTPG